jgi:hypothetical protein
LQIRVMDLWVLQINGGRLQIRVQSDIPSSDLVSIGTDNFKAAWS